MRSRLPSRRTALVLSIATLAEAASSGVAVAAASADADPASAPITAFYVALLETMKVAHRLSTKARYDRLEPAVRTAFDLDTMTRIAVGPAWTGMDADTRRALTEQFSRMTIATYANRFDGYSGERLEVDPAVEVRGESRVVHSRLVQASGEPVALNYLMRNGGDGWKAIDVYLSGTISELATRRSEFGTILRSGGPGSLISNLRERSDKLLAS